MIGTATAEARAALALVLDAARCGELTTPTPVVARVARVVRALAALAARGDHRSAGPVCLQGCVCDALRKSAVGGVDMMWRGV